MHSKQVVAYKISSRVNRIKAGFSSIIYLSCGQQSFCRCLDSQYLFIAKPEESASLTPTPIYIGARKSQISNKPSESQVLQIYFARGPRSDSNRPNSSSIDTHPLWEFVHAWPIASRAFTLPSRCLAVIDHLCVDERCDQPIARFF